MAPSFPEILHTWSEDMPSGSILHVLGEVDLSSARSLQATLMRLIGRGRPVIVDCSELQYLDMKGVHVLEDCHERAEQLGQRFVLVGSLPCVHKILVLTKLHERMPVVDTVREALAILGQEGTTPGWHTS
jgi:anti-anti-sigma factor